MLDDFPSFVENVLLDHSESLYSFKLFLLKEHKQLSKKIRFSLTKGFQFTNMHVRIFNIFSLLILKIFLCLS